MGQSRKPGNRRSDFHVLRLMHTIEKGGTRLSSHAATLFMELTKSLPLDQTIGTKGQLDDSTHKLEHASIGLHGLKTKLQSHLRPIREIPPIRVLESANDVSRFTFHVSRITFHVSRFTFHVLRTGFIIFALMMLWTVALGEALGRTIDLFSFSPTGTDVLLKAFEGDQTATVILTQNDKVFEPKPQTDSEAFQKLLLGEKYNQIDTIKTFQKQMGMKDPVPNMVEPAADGQFGPTTWTVFMNLLGSDQNQPIREIDSLKDLGVEKLKYTNVDLLLKAPVSEGSLLRLIQFSTDQKEVTRIPAWLNGEVKSNLPAPFVDEFINALAKKRPEIARWMVKERKVNSIDEFVKILVKDYPSKPNVTEELIQLVLLLKERGIAASDSYKALLVTYLRENKAKFSTSQIRDFLKNRSSGDWEQVVKAELIKGVSGVVIIVGVGVGVLIIAGVGVLLFQRGVIPSRRRQTQPTTDREGGDVMEEVAAQLPRSRGERHQKPSKPPSRQQTVKPSGKPPQVVTPLKGEMEPPPKTAPKPEIREGEAPAEPAPVESSPAPSTVPEITALIRTVLADEIPMLVKTAVETQLPEVLSKFKEQVVEESVKNILAQVNASMTPWMTQLKDDALKVTDVSKQLHTLADSTKEELTRKAASAGKQLEDKWVQIQETVEQIDQKLQAFPKHLEAWRQLMDAQQITELQKQHLKFDNILKDGNANFNAVLATVSQESSQQRPVLLDIQNKVVEAEQLVEAIVKATGDEFDIGTDKFSGIFNDIARLKANLSQAIQAHHPLDEPEVQSFGDYYRSLGDDALPNEMVYEDHLRQLGDRYREYYTGATERLKILMALKGHSADDFTERWERLATNTIVAFTTLLDEAIKNSGKPKDAIETKLQQLFTLVELKEIQVNEKQQKYNSDLHEAIRWERREDLESDMIIELSRRGFIFKNEVLRPARVVVRQ